MAFFLTGNLFKSYVFLLLIVIFGGGIILFAIRDSSSEIVEIENGTLDLFETDFTQEINAFVKGESAFYWQELLSYRDLDKLSQKEGISLDIEKSWVGEKKALANYSHYGYGTYYFKIILPPGEKKLHLLFYPKSNLAYEVEINGVSHGRNGMVGKNANTSKSSYSEQNIFLNTQEEVLHFFIKASEFEFYSYNLGFEIKLSNNFDVVNGSNDLNIVNVIMIGFFFSFFIYTMIFYLIRREDSYNLWISLLSFSAILRVISVNDRLLNNLLGMENWGITIKVEILSFFLAPLFYFLLYYSLYKTFFNRKFFMIIISLIILANIIILASPSTFFPYILPPFRILIGVFFLYVLFIVIQAIKKEKKIENYYFFYINVLIFFFILHDSFIHNNLLHNRSDIASFAIFFLIIYQSTFNFYKLQTSYQNQEKILNVFKKFVPANFINFITDNKAENFKLGDGEKTYTGIMFLNFEAIFNTQKISDEEYIENLNDFLTQIDLIVNEYGGFIDKYLNKDIMAVFIFDKKTENDGINSIINAGVKIIKSIKKLNQRQKKIKFKIHIGIHSGENIVGTVGAQERMDSTVIGDNVNTAARFQQLASRFSISLLVSEETKNNTINFGISYPQQYIGEFNLKGKEKKHKAYRIFAERLSSDEITKRKYFNLGIRAWEESNWKEAKKYFTKIKKECQKIEEIDNYYLSLIKKAK